MLKFVQLFWLINKVTQQCKQKTCFIFHCIRIVFKKDLEHEISHRAGGGTDFRRMLVSAVQANREELTPQQIQQARQMGLESVIDR